MDCMTLMRNCGDPRHPQTVMNELALRLGFKITAASGHPIADCWLFTIEPGICQEDMPPWINEIRDGRIVERR